MTRKMNIFIWSMSGALLGGGVVGVTFLVLKLLNDKNIDLGPPSYYKGKDDGTSKFNFKWYADSTGNQFMSDDEYKTLDEYLSTHLYYGPESDALKEIVFGDRNVIGEGAAGLYFGSTRQIFINIEEYVGAKGLTYLDKQNAVSEIIAHEYGHHFAHIYLKGYKANNNIWPTKLTYDPNGDATVWNNQYLTNWENMNHYTGNNSDYKAPYSTIMKYGNDPQKSYDNINHNISLNQLYNMANSKDHPNPFKTNDNYYWGVPRTPTTPGTILPPTQHPIIPLFSYQNNDMSNQQYLYSSDEQFTRMTEMLMWPKKYFEADGTILHDAKYLVPFSKTASSTPLWSTQAYDLAHVKMVNSLRSWNNKNLSTTKMLIYPNYPFGGLLKWNPKGINMPSYASNYYKFLINTMGYGSQISHIYTKNTKEIVRKRGNLISINGNSSNQDMIKLSGYTDKQWKYLSIMKNGVSIKNMPLNSNKYEDKGKSSIFHYFGRKSMNTSFNPTSGDPYSNWSSKDDQSEWLKPTTNKYSYIMKDFTNINDLKNNEYTLIFNNGDTAAAGNVTLDNAAIGNFSGAKNLTTFEEYMPQNNLYWNLYFKNNKLVFNKSY